LGGRPLELLVVSIGLDRRGESGAHPADRAAAAPAAATERLGAAAGVALAVVGRLAATASASAGRAAAAALAGPAAPLVCAPPMRKNETRSSMAFA